MGKLLLVCPHCGLLYIDPPPDSDVAGGAVGLFCGPCYRAPFTDLDKIRLQPVRRGTVELG